MTYAIVLAAGSGKRMGISTPKQFLALAGKPVLAWTLDAFEKAEGVDAVVLVTASDLVEACREQFASGKVVDVVAGGAERQDSVACGLSAIPESADVIAVHDGARAFVTPEDIDAVVSAAETY
ncbi:MAG: NTP transferase domain-containing protein, partial [Candidatus Latescibacteria bacterium]|nr:NTP transferase domain-containing protein [Candidatus Latescibacterota bacterium]